MARKSVIEKSERMIGKVNGRYDLSASEIMEFYNDSEDGFDMIVNSFRYGYRQGMKAAKADQKEKTA